MEPTGPPSGNTPAPSHDRKAILDARKKFSATLDDEVLDYKHNHPGAVENCVTTLLKIFNNVITSPTEQKYRQVKAASNAYKNNVAALKGGERLMLLAGWTPQVVELQKFWVFEAAAESLKFSILKESASVLEKSLAHIHEKAERARKEAEGKKAVQAAIREKVLMAIEEDKLDRKVKTELQGHVPVFPTAEVANKEPSAEETAPSSEWPRQSDPAV